MIRQCALCLLFLVSVSGPVFAQDAIRPGLTSEQLIALKGQPYYQTEHFSNRAGEQVWLYTKKKEDKTVNEKQITDPQTQWSPTLHRKTTTRTCEVGDVFVEVSKGVVQSVIPANASMAYGPCVITNLEEFLPIVNGVVSAAPARKTQNTSLEKSAPAK